MSLSRKLGLSAALVSLLGLGVGIGLAVGSSTTSPQAEAPSAVVLERHEVDALREPGERPIAMITTRPATSTPSSPVLAAAREASVREEQRLPSPALVREAHERRVDGSRAAEGLRVRRLLVATGIEAREPVGASDLFDGEEERLYVFVDLANRGEATEVEVSFEPETVSADAHVTGLVELEVPARVGRHRTWAWSRNVHAPGRWSAIVRDLEGRELARTSFVVE